MVRIQSDLNSTDGLSFCFIFSVSIFPLFLGWWVDGWSHRQAWKDVGRLPKDKAAQEYIALLDEVAPTWRAEILTMEDRTKDGGGGAGEEEEEIDLDATTSEDDWDTQVPRPPGTGAGQGDGDGFGINVSRPVLRPEDEEGESLEGMFLAASKGDLESIKRAVQQEGKDINSKTPAEQGELSCLHIAVDRDHCALIPHLVEMKANLDQMDDMQQTPLHYAVTIERLDCVQLLLELGADPDLPDETGETPAMAAGKARDPEIRKAFASPQASERGAAEKEKTD